MQIFVSSTFEDLVDYRKKATDAIERLGQQGIRMEVFGARPDLATEACFEEIELSDAFVGIYAHRYGFIPKLSSTSITEQEFDFALAKKKPIFAFILDEDYPWLPRFIDLEPNHSKLTAFKHKVEEAIVRERFTTAEDLGFKVSSSIGRYLVSRRVKQELERLPKKDSVSTPEGRDQIARRAARIGNLIAGSLILLVNDVPEEMSHVVELLQQLKLRVDVVMSSDQAISQLSTQAYDVVISDMSRDGVDDEGIRFLTRMRSANLPCRTIFTVGRYQPERGTPPYAFGITNRVDELLNLVFDALERVRG
jgi:CheY-like chemotaxis protein